MSGVVLFGIGRVVRCRLGFVLNRSILMLVLIVKIVGCVLGLVVLVEWFVVIVV